MCSNLLNTHTHIFSYISRVHMITSSMWSLSTSNKWETKNILKSGASDAYKRTFKCEQDHHPLQTFSLRKKKKQRKMKVFIWFLFFIPIVYASDHYDYFQLVLQWPPTVCGGTCTPSVPQNFTMLGFWPSDSTIPGSPINCPGSPFDPTVVNF